MTYTAASHQVVIERLRPQFVEPSTFFCFVFSQLSQSTLPQIPLVKTDFKFKFVQERWTVDFLLIKPVDMEQMLVEQWVRGMCFKAPVADSEDVEWKKV